MHHRAQLLYAAGAGRRRPAGGRRAELGTSSRCRQPVPRGTEITRCFEDVANLAVDQSGSDQTKMITRREFFLYSGSPLLASLALPTRSLGDDLSEKFGEILSDLRQRTRLPAIA